MTLSATSRPSASCTATKTWPWPPSPRARTMRKRPAMTWPMSPVSVMARTLSRGGRRAHVERLGEGDCLVDETHRLAAAHGERALHAEVEREAPRAHLERVQRRPAEAAVRDGVQHRGAVHGE